MEEKNQEKRPIEEQTEETAEPAHGHDEEHAHGNYMFALKILLILAAIILIIVILKATGVPVAVRDWFSAAVVYPPRFLP